MAPQGEARQLIDEMLKAADRQLHDYKKSNLGGALGVAVSEFLLTGLADYTLLPDKCRTLETTE